MILLIILLALISASFTVILEKEKLLLRDKKSRYLTSLIFTVLGIAVFILFFWNSTSLVLIISAGIIYILISFVYLDIFAKEHIFNHFSVHLILILILCAVNNVNWQSVLYIILIFIAACLVLFYILNKLKISTNYQNNNIKQLFELGRILSGIYLLIIGIIMATDRIEFLEKMARYLF